MRAIDLWFLFLRMIEVFVEARMMGYARVLTLFSYMFF